MVDLEALPAELAAARDAWFEDRSDPTKFETYAYGAGIYRTNTESVSPGGHWFCDPANYDASLSSMVMFSYNDTLAALQNYSAMLARMLGRCSKCAKAYQAGRDDLAERYAEVGIVGSASQAMIEKVAVADRRRLAVQLEKQMLILRGDPENQAVRQQLTVAVVEVLHSFCCLTDGRFLDFFARLKPYLFLDEKMAADYKDAPGTVTLLFSENADAHKFALDHLFAEPGLLAAAWTSEHNKMYLHASSQVRLITKQDYAWYNMSLIAQAFTDLPEDSEKYRGFQAQANAFMQFLPATGRRIGACSMLAEFLRMKVKFSLPDLVSILQVLFPTGFLSQFKAVSSGDPSGGDLPTDYLSQDACESGGSVERVITLLSTPALVPQNRDLGPSMPVSNQILMVLLSGEKTLERFQHLAMRLIDGILSPPGGKYFHSEGLGVRLQTFEIVAKSSATLAHYFAQLPQSETSLESMRALSAIVRFHVNGLLLGYGGFTLQSERERKELLVWEVLCRDHQLVRSNTNLVKAILAGQELLPFVHDTLPGIGKAEESVAIMFDLLGRHSHTKNIKELLNSEECTTSILLSTFSSVGRTARAAVDVWVDANSHSGEHVEAITEFLKSDIEKSIFMITKTVAKIIRMHRFAVMQAAVKFLSTVFEVLYEINGGIASQLQTELAACSTNVLLQLWTATWDLLAFSTEKIRKWAAGGIDRKSMRAYILDTFLLYQRLLNGFGSVESSMPPTETNVDSKMIQPAAKAIVKMNDLLKLRDQELLDMGYSIYLEIVTLIKRYSVPTPASLIVSLTELAASPSLIPADEYGALLTLTRHFSNEEISDLCETRDRRMTELKGGTPSAKPGSSQPETQQPKHASPSPASSAPPSAGDAEDLEGVVSGTMPGPKLPSQRQGRMDQYFVKTPTLVQQQPRHTFGMGVRPSAPAHVSATELMRRRLAQTQNPTSVSTRIQPAPTLEVHPARPAGFNSRKKPEDMEPKRPLPTPATRQQSLDSMDGSSSEDESNGALFQLGKKAGASATKPQFRGVPDYNLEKQKRDNELRRMRARLTVAPDGLHRMVLSWDYFSDAVYPKGFSQDSMSVPDQFRSVLEYQNIMTPLLHLEAWQGIQRSRKENPESPFHVTVGKRVSCDDFIDLHVSIQAREWIDRKLGESDLLLLSFDPNLSDKVKQAPQRPTADMLHFLARVKEGSVVIRRQKEFVDVQLRTYPDVGVRHYLAQGRVLNGLKVTSTKTIDREYTALMALEHYDLASNILSAKPAQLIDFKESQVSELTKTLSLNSSQAKAVLQSVHSTGFNLIQGPPGTGKTKTILGFLSAFFGSGVGDASKRILLCAPSNAAVDELLLRIKRGVPNKLGKPMNLNVVRIGRSDVVHSEVREFTLESRISKAITVTAETVDHGLIEKHSQLLSQRRELDKKLFAAEDEKLDAEQVAKLESELFNLNNRIRESGRLVTAQRESIKVRRESRDKEYKKLQSELLGNANIVCATLSGAAYEFLASLQLTFETVIIDEAAQSVELSALIPLKYGARRCLLVGDPNQLPPTVLSREAKNLKYEQSLFVRMFNQHRDQVRMLDTQFRMHPDISVFPSNEFYDGKLLDGPGMAETTKQAWHSDPLFGPYRFLSVAGQQERFGNMSYRNHNEAAVACELVDRLKKMFPNESLTNRIGVISPYKQQVNLLRDKFQRAFGNDVLDRVSFSTVDGFQGQEKDIIILSCVRADPDANGVGFLGDIRRMNVAITRAKSSLWVLGHPASLCKNPVWRRVLDDAQRRGMIVENATGSEIRHGKYRIPSSRRSAAPSVTSSATSSVRTSREPSPLVKQEESQSNERVLIVSREVSEKPRTSYEPGEPLQSREPQELCERLESRQAQKEDISQDASQDESQDDSQDKSQDDSQDDSRDDSQENSRDESVSPNDDDMLDGRFAGSSRAPKRKSIGPWSLRRESVDASTEKRYPRPRTENSSPVIPMEARFAPRPSSPPSASSEGRRPYHPNRGDKRSSFGSERPRHPEYRPTSRRPDLFPSHVANQNNKPRPHDPSSEARHPERRRPATSGARQEGKRKRSEPSLFIPRRRKM